MYTRGTVGAAAIVVALFAGSAVASEVTVGLVGEPGPDGNPAFEVYVDDTVVGGGTLAPPPGVKVRELGDVAAVAARISFPIPDGLLTANSVVSVRMTNDSNDATSDTTLYVASVSVDGAAADVSKGEIVAGSEVMPLYFAPGGPLILAWNASARFAAPEGGWSQPAVAEAAPAVQPDTATAEAATAPAEEVAAPAEDAAVVAEAAPATPACGVTDSLAVLDFENGMYALTPAGAKQIDGFFTGKDVTGCKLEIAGYASLGGEPAVNTAMSEARAKTVLDYVNAKSLGFASATSSGQGGTDQFGPPRENRRVVLTISP